MILGGHIQQDWFESTMFSPSVTEALGLLLRNQVERLTIAYYQQAALPLPDDPTVISFIWRYVMDNIAYDNQLVYCDMWRSNFHMRLENDQRRVSRPGVTQRQLSIGRLDRLIQSLLNNLPENLPEPNTAVFDTSNPATYETLLPTYHNRYYPMVPPTRHQPYETLQQRYARMTLLQQPLFITDARNTQFRLVDTENEDDTAFYMRPVGPLYNISSLYLTHQGRLPPMDSNAQVRHAIQQLIVRDEVARNLPHTTSQNSNEAFEDNELHCLLRALINGTIQPDLYNGRALPLPLVDQLMERIDNVTNQFLQYAQLPAQAQQWMAPHPITLYIETLENDAMYHVTTGAHDDNATWYRSFLAYATQDECPEPTVALAAILRDMPGNETVTESNILRAIERALATNRRQRRPTRAVHSTPSVDIGIPIDPPESDDNDRYLGYQPDPTCVTPLRNLWRSLDSFFHMLDTYPRQHEVSPGISVTSMTDITAQISVDLGTSNPIPLHQRDISVTNSQRGVFDNNVQRHLHAFPEINTSSSSSARTNPMDITQWPMEQFSLLEEAGEAKESAAATLKPKARPITRSMTATSQLRSSNYRRTQPAQSDSVLGDEDMPGLREDNSDEDIPDLIGNTGVADSDEEDFVSATRRRAPTVPWHRSGRHRVTDDQKKARAQRQAQLARQTLQQPGPVMVAAPRSPIIAGLSLNTMVQNPQFFDEGQISDQRQYELGLPPLVPHDPEGSPNEGRYQRALAYMMQARGLPESVQIQADSVPTTPQQTSSQPMQVAQTLQLVSDEAGEYASRRFYKDDPNNSANPRLPSATAVAEALPATTVYMDAGTMEMIPQARELQSYTDLLNENDQLARALAQAARDTEPDWPLTEPTYALPTPKRARMVVQYRSPPTSPTIVQMVSSQEEPSHGYNVNSPAYFVPSLSPSTTPESGQRRPATWSLRDTTTQRRVPPQSEADGTNISPNPTHDPNRG